MNDSNPTGEGNYGEERRVDRSLRLLVDEMLMQLRTAAQTAEWTPEERERAENDLRRIMDSVRHRALDGERSTTID